MEQAFRYVRPIIVRSETRHTIPLFGYVRGVRDCLICRQSPHIKMRWEVSILFSLLNVHFITSIVVQKLVQFYNS